LSGALGLTSAAVAHGWKVRVPPDRPMVWVPRHRKVSAARREDVDLRWGMLNAAELEAGITAPVRTVVDCARLLPFDDALAVPDSALRSTTVTRDAGRCGRAQRKCGFSLATKARTPSAKSGPV